MASLKIYNLIQECVLQVMAYHILGCCPSKVVRRYVVVLLGRARCDNSAEQTMYDVEYLAKIERAVGDKGQNGWIGRRVWSLAD